MTDTIRASTVPCYNWEALSLTSWRLPLRGLVALLLRKEQADQLELGPARARLRQHSQGEVAAAAYLFVLSHKDALDRGHGGAAQHVVRVDDGVAAAGATPLRCGSHISNRAYGQSR